MSDAETTEPDSPNPKRIGNMNGPWAIVFKFALATYPFFIVWSVWVTGNVYDYIGWKGKGERFTAGDGQIIVTKMHEEVRSEQATMRNEIRTEQTAAFAKLEAKIEGVQVSQMSMRESLSDMKADFRHAFNNTQPKPIANP